MHQLPDVDPGETQEWLDSLDAVKAQAAADEQMQGETVSGAGDEITDAEFESLLDQLHGKGQFSVEVAAPPVAVSSEATSDEITDAEFESLLDQLHGKGTFQVDALPATQAPAPAVPDSSANSDEISEHEFEALLDQLHGKGKFGGDVAAVEAPAAVQAQAPAAAKAESQPCRSPFSRSTKSAEPILITTRLAARISGMLSWTRDATALPPPVLRKPPRCLIAGRAAPLAFCGRPRWAPTQTFLLRLRLLRALS